MKNDTHTEPEGISGKGQSSEEIHRYRLTFDPNPKELARREAGIGSHVVLLWSRRTGRAAVVVEEDSTGELVELDVDERENPLDLYNHPYAYMALPGRGHPGRALRRYQPVTA